MHPKFVPLHPSAQNRPATASDNKFPNRRNLVVPKQPLGRRQPASKPCRRRSSHHTESDMYDSDSDVENPTPAAIVLSSDTESEDANSDVFEDPHDALHAIIAHHDASSIGNDSTVSTSATADEDSVEHAAAHAEDSVSDIDDGGIVLVMPTLPVVDHPLPVENHPSPIPELLSAGILNPTLVVSQHQPASNRSTSLPNAPANTASISASGLGDQGAAAVANSDGLEEEVTGAEESDHPVQNQLGLLPSPMRRRELYYPGMDLCPSDDDMRNLSDEMDGTNDHSECGDNDEEGDRTKLGRRLPRKWRRW